MLQQEGEVKSGLYFRETPISEKMPTVENFRPFTYKKLCTQVQAPTWP